MVRKIIFDSKLIMSIIGKKADMLIIEYNVKNKRAFYKTNSMKKRKPICIDRVINL